ncbi:M15 family metallopeptidase [Symbiopectobacterium sp. Eva_TO]
MYFTFEKLKVMFIGVIFLPYTSANADIHILSQKECDNMHASGVMTKTNPVSCERLRRVNFRHVNFNGTTEEGNVVILDAIAEHTEKIFSELFEQRFPIHKAITMEHYEGNDEAAMADNNTSAFNGRPITGGTSWSKHAYGVAIDINPLQNPYLSFSTDGTAKVLPPSAATLFVNRSNVRPDKKKREGMAEDVVDIFTRHGFMRWGGEWDSPIDYQHFEIGSNDFVNKLINQSPDSARRTFNHYVESYNFCMKKHSKGDFFQKRINCIERVRQ